MSDRDDRLDEMLDEYEGRLAAGETPDLGEYRTRAPDLYPEFETLTRRLTAASALLAAVNRPAEFVPPGEATAAFARYHDLRLLGAGGLGVLFTAREDEVGRTVALKFLKRDDAAARGRFRREARVTARLEHSGVVPIYGLGTTPDGRPCYAMRLVRGRPLSDLIAEAHAGPDPAGRVRELVGRLAAACVTVAYAHSRGVVHRDLKPDNIMVDEYDVTLVVDWGMARVADEADPPPAADRPAAGPAATRLTGAVGFRAPEQLGDPGLGAVGPATDVFGLGATLYAVLTGRPPWQRATEAEAVADTRAGRLVAPRAFQPHVPPTLDAICRKALAHRPADRYPSPADLAADLRAYLELRTVSAYPGTWADRLVRLVRRNRAAAAGLGLAVAIAALAAPAVTLSVSRATAAEQRRIDAVEAARVMAGLKAEADGLRDRAVRLQYAADMKLAHQHLVGGDRAGAVRVLERNRPAAGAADLRGFEWGFLWNLCHPERTIFDAKSAAWSVAVSPDEGRVASAHADGTVRVWRLAGGPGLTLTAYQKPPTYMDGPRAVAFSPDGKRLAAPAEGGRVRVWDAATGQLVRELSHAGAPVHVAFSPDGGRLAVAVGPTDPSNLFSASHFTPGVVKLWNTADWTEARAFTLDPGRHARSVAFSPDGQRLAAAVVRLPGQVGKVAVWRADTGDTVHTLIVDKPLPMGGLLPALLQFTHGGKGLFLHQLNKLAMWNAATGKPFADKQQVAAAVAVDPDTLAFAFIGDGGVTRREGDDETVLPLDRGTQVNGLALGPSSRLLAVACQDGTVVVWRPEAMPDRRARPDGIDDHLTAAALTADGGRLLTGGLGGAVLARAVGGGAAEPYGGNPQQTLGVGWAADGRRAAAVNDSGRLHLWDGPGQAPARIIEAWAENKDRLIRRVQETDKDGKSTHKVLEETTEVGVAFRPGGDEVACGSLAGPVTIWDVRSGNRSRTVGDLAATVTGLAYSPKGGRLATASADGRADLWDAATGGRVRSLRPARPPRARLTFRSDGARLAADGWDDTLLFGSRSPNAAGRLWVFDPPSLGLREIVKMSGANVATAAFSPDGRLVAVSDSAGGQVDVWEAATGEQLMALPVTPTHAGVRLAFDPNSRRLATADATRLRVWDLDVGQEVLAVPHSAGEEVLAVVFTRDGRRLVAAGRQQPPDHPIDRHRTVVRTLDGRERK